MARIPTASAPRSISFVDQDRTFTCLVEPRGRADATLWWWFSVSGGNTSRYAPFLASVEDTELSIRTRIVEYYETHLARRAAPMAPRWGRPAR